MQDIKIIKMKKADLRALYGMGIKHWSDHNWLTMNYLKNSFSQPGINYSALFDGRVVGGVIMVYEDIVKNWIRYIIVAKKFRQKGIGTLLLKKVFKKLKKGENIFVDTGVSDKKAIEFYLENGFSNHGKVTGLYGRQSAYFFKKIIR